MKEGLKKRLLRSILQVLEKFQIGLSWMARRTCGGTDTGGADFNTPQGCALGSLQCQERQRAGISYTELSTLQNWVRLPLEAYHPKSGNHITIKQDVLTTAFFHEMKTRIVIETGILFRLQKHTASPSGKTPGFCFHWAILGVFGLTDQGSGHHKAEGLAVLLLLPIWLVGDLG